MNRNLKIALGIAVGVGVIYLGYQYFFKKTKNEGVDNSKEEIIYNKANREVVLVENV